MSELETPPPPEQPPSTPPSAAPPGAPQDPNIILPENAKDPVVILIVALFFGPIGYFVMNQWQKGLAGIAAWVLAIIFSIITCGLGVILYVPMHVVVVIDSYMQSKKLRDGTSIGQWTFFDQGR